MTWYDHDFTHTNKMYAFIIKNVMKVLDELTSKCVLPENCSCHCDPVPENCSLVFVPSGNETCACPVCKG